MKISTGSSLFRDS